MTGTAAPKTPRLSFSGTLWLKGYVSGLPRANVSAMDRYYRVTWRNKLMRPSIARKDPKIFSEIQV